MKTNWETEMCNDEPMYFQKVSEDTYIQRKNIEKETGVDENGENITRWKCQSRFISKDVYEDYIDVLNTPAQMEIMHRLQGNDEVSLTIMGAIAEIYEMNL